MPAPPRIALVAACLLAAAAAYAGNNTRVGSYDFGYLLGGDAAAKPVQVFDDGQHTYLQFRSGAAIPAIFTSNAGVPQLLAPVEEGPYLRVPQLHGRLLLQLGRAQATAIHARGERPDAPPLTVQAASGLTQPYTGASVPAGARVFAALPATAAAPGRAETALERHSYATPIKGDGVQWTGRNEPVEHAIVFARGSHALLRDAQQSLARIVQRAGAAARFTVIGRDDDSDREGLERTRADVLHEALRRAGVSADRIQLRTGPMKPASRAGAWEATLLVEEGSVAAAPKPPSTPSAPAPTAARPPLPVPAGEVPAGGFTLAVADGTISGAVRRWAQALGYQLVWDAPEQLDAPITGSATLPASHLAAALESLLHGLKNHGYSLEVTLHANRVIRFTPAATPTAPTAPAATPAPAKPAAPGSLLRAGASSS
ncbi:MAG TPA: TcpQ domain-containing protein [Ramlibacter sp.]|jgi:hypothetical protein|nr:TcpQ domain-containing protein [Ramlibacter sp.]